MPRELDPVQLTNTTPAHRRARRSGPHQDAAAALPRCFSYLMLCALGLSTACAHAQSPTQIATLDERQTVEVGQVVSIQSQFRDLPVVEPHLSAHPADNDVLLAAAMIVTDINNPYESCRLSSFFSNDGGRTWTETAHDIWGYDPWTAILADGQTAMTWLGSEGAFQHEFPVLFFSSADAGAHWSDTIQRSEGAHDGTKIASHGEDFYFTTVRFRDDMGADVVLLHRRGAGPFREVAMIDGRGVRLNFCEPAVLTSGAVVVPASRFLENAWVQIYDPARDALSEPHHVSNRPGGGRGYMRLTADTSPASPYTDRLYFVRALRPSAHGGGVWINVSADGGQTWGDDTRIDRFPEGATSRANVPSAAVNKDGVLGVSWVDTQDDPDRTRTDVYFAISTDGGVSFQRPVRVTSASTDPRTSANADVANKFPGGGHYLGIAAKPDGSFQLLWSDSETGVFQLKTVNIRVRPESIR